VSPKSGTNLLSKAVGLFPGIHPKADFHIGQSSLVRFAQSGDQRAVKVSIGVDWPQAVPLGALRQALKRLRRGHYATEHVPFSEKLAGLLLEKGIKFLLILRDPRDVAVLHANYVVHSPEHFLMKSTNRLPSQSELCARLLAWRHRGVKGWSCSTSTSVFKVCRLGLRIRLLTTTYFIGK